MSFKIKIKVIGIGGSGVNAINRMKRKKDAFHGIELISINTDAQDLKSKKADLKLRIGRKLTQGLGSGSSATLGRRAAEEQRQEITEILRGADIVFIATGLGGGTGSGASPIIAEIASNLGILTIGVVTMPFSFEGQSRFVVARKARAKLEEKTDSLIVIPNDNLLKFLAPDISLAKAFETCDDILWQAVKGIAALVVLPGIVNVNFADIRTIMKNSGAAFFGVGKAKGKDRAVQAAKNALNSPLLNIPISKAKGILFNISGGEDISLYEINEAAKVITENAGPNAKVVFGAIQDENLSKGEMKCTVIATGF